MTKTNELVAPRSYSHVTKALYERVWALQPRTLQLMSELLEFRLAGGHFTEVEIEERLAAGRADNGDRGGAMLAGSVAVIPMYGIIAQRASVLADSSQSGVALDDLRMSLREALADPAVKAVVFDIDSPGGSVDGVQEFADEIRRARQGSKPIVAQVNTLAASAAYWLAANMSEIALTPSGEVGSIGVYAMHEDTSKAAEAAGIKTTFISAGPYKVEGNSFEPLGDEARASIQEQVDTFYQQFLGDVAKGRKASVEAVATGYGEGRTLLAKKALAAGMVDHIATLEETVNRLQPRSTSITSQRAGAAQPTQIAAASVNSLPDRAWNQRMARKGLFGVRT